MTRDECNLIKPDPEPLHRILEMYGRDDFVYVGDSDHDAMACHSAGGIFVLINTREYDEETIAELSTDTVIERLTELPAVLTYL